MTQNAQHRQRSVNLKGISLRRSSVKIKPKVRSATSPPKALSSKSSELRGWPSIARFLGMSNSTAHRWAKEGMPVRREGRNVVASREELNQWLQRTTGEPVGVHVVSPDSDILKDLRASLAVQKSSKNSASQPKNESRSSRGRKRSKRKRPVNPDQ
jgi:predicted DNA-binding transcriptional regulator AlpA